jgi:hypothetical protein
MSTRPTTNNTRSFGTRTKLVAYGVILTASFAGAAGLAVAVGPIDTSSDSHSEPPRDVGHETGGGRPHVPGVSIDADGFRIVPTEPSVAADLATAYSFRIVDAEGDAVIDFDVTHERRLHLIVVSRNLVDYHHLHPTQSTDGLWTVDVPALPAGSYRVFADTRPTGAEGITLGTDLAVGGGVAANDAGAASPAGENTVIVDGYDIEMAGRPAVGESTLTFTVRANGDPVVPDPYLGASGHLVALRTGDLAFLHVHPLGDATQQQPQVRFAAEFPTAGTYRLFLDFSVGGAVRTAAFTLEVPETEGDLEPQNSDNTHDTPRNTGEPTDTHEAGH